MDFSNRNLTTEQVTSNTPVLTDRLDEGQLVVILDQTIAEAQNKMSEKRINDRQDINRRYWKGQQVDTAKLDTRYQTAHVDNVVYQNTENRIVLASSRIPEITLAPPKDESELIARTKRAERSIRNRIDSNTIKRLIKDGLRHHEVDLIGIIKVRWDPRKGKQGDYVFELIDPKSVVFSSRSKIVHDGFTVEGVDVLVQWLEEPTQLVLSKFPAKAQQLKDLWGFTQMPQKIRYAEAHFAWYNQQGELVEGVAWKYGNIILDQTRTPYYDYQGAPWINPETGQFELKKRNHFDRPRKPFILFSYQNLQDWVYDTTTPLEQAIKINAIINRRERQITEIADRTIPKIVFNKNAFKSGDAEKFVAQMNNPRDHIQLTGENDDIRKAVMVIQGNAPDRILYEDVAALRGRIDSLFNTHGTTRGEVRSAESGISKQISREGDLAITDDIVDFVVERVVYEMASWGVQMQKLYYTTPRPIRNLGRDGEVQYDETSAEDIDDDIEVMVKASATDPALRRANAQDFANAKVTDPYSYFEDMDVAMPKERVKRLVSWMRGSQDFYRDYMDMLGIQDEMFDSTAKAQADLDKVINGDNVTPEQIPDQAYAETLVDFVQDEERMGALDEEQQQRVMEYIAKVRQMVDNQSNETGAPGQATQGLPAAAGAEGFPAPTAA